MRCALALAALAALAGCPRAVPPPDYGPEGPIADAALLASRVRARGALLWSLRGEVKTRLHSKDGSMKVQDLVALARPDQLRVDVLSFFGQPLAVLATDGQRFGYLDVEEARFYTGRASAATLGRFLPVALAPADAVALLLGDVPEVSERAVPSLAVAAEGYTLTFLDPSGEMMVVTVSAQGARPLAVRAESGGSVRWEARFEEFREIGPSVLPYKIAIEDPRAGSGVELSYQEVEVNLALAGETFRIEAPAGAAVVPVD